MRIAILYICTGKYSIFWEPFYSSSKEYLLRDCNKHYFVFTDDYNLLKSETSDVTFIKQDKLGWPLDSLNRFSLFHSIKNKLEFFDYIFFFNANMKFLAHVGKEILPASGENGLTAVLHPYFYREIDNNKLIYDRNKKSVAYVPFGKGKYYYQGCLNGGTRDAYLSLIENLEKRIKEDFEKNLIARWHDESHLNHYLLNLNIRRLSPAYAYPEGENIGLDEEIIILSVDKKKFGGHSVLRERNSHEEDREELEKLHQYKTNYFTKVKNKIKTILNFS